jgi:hypothetical protein
MTAENYLGFDPGGQTGVGLLTVENGQCRCATYSAVSVDDAINWATALLPNQTPSAAGVDTFLYWETGNGGWRGADRWLRHRYPNVSNSVLCSNSAAGAMSVQGMSLAILCRKHWPNIGLIETHPKVLYYALTKLKHEWPSRMTEWLLKQMNCASAEIANDHCWDAALSAWAAMMGHTGCWEHDLRALSSVAIEPAGQCAFWWPEA